MTAPEARPAGFLIDHLVILVGNLAAAVDGYRTLGFLVIPGGRHAGGATHNALIVLSDGTYLELVAFTHRLVLPALRALNRLGLLERVASSKPSFGHRLRTRGAVGEGLVDFAVRPGSLQRDADAARARGLVIDGPVAGGRVRPDGLRVAWQLGFPQAPALPFLCADLTPRTLRVPVAGTHPNGALGIASITVAVTDLRRTAREYAALLGREPRSGGAAGPGGSEPVEFRLGGSAIRLATRHVTDRPRGRRGPFDGPVLVKLGANISSERTLDRRLTAGAHIKLVRNPAPDAPPAA